MTITRRFALVVLLLAVAGVATAATSLTFATPVPYATGLSPKGIAAADLNGDGVLDLVVVNTGVSSVSVLLGIPGAPGTYAARVDYAVSIAEDIAIADVNGDGVPDILVVSLDNESLSVLKGNGDGTFATAKTFFAGSGPTSLAIADFDRDGTLDVVVGHNSSFVSILLGNASAPGTFPTRANYNTGGGGPIRVVVGDFDRDGFPDVAAALGPTGKVAIFRNYGNGTLEAPVAYAVPGTASAITVGDFDRDGVLDLAVGDSGSKSISVLLGSAATPGTFTNTGVTYPTAAGALSALAVADLNGDGRPDLVVTVVDTGGPVSVLTGNGDGTFNPRVDFTTGDVAMGVVVADLDRDGRPDIAVTDRDSNTVSVLLNANTFVVTGGFAQADFAVTAFTEGVAAADVNRDGIADLVAYFGDGTVEVRLGNGDGTFAAATVLTSTGSGLGLAIGDLDGDGWPDLAWGTSTLSVALSNGDGTFDAPAVVVSGLGSADDVALADLRRSGILDAVITDSVNGLVHVLYGTGHGTFSGGATYAVANARRVAIADLDGDGALDIVTANSNGDDVAVLMNSGNGSFTTAMYYTVGSASSPTTIAVGDLDRDGIPDVVVSRNGGFSVLLGVGDGTLGPATDVPTPYTPRSVLLADINRDGVLDLVGAYGAADGGVVLLPGLGDGTFGSVTVWPTTTGLVLAAAVADVDRDGRPDVAVFGNTSGTLSVLTARAAVFSFSIAAYSVGEFPGAKKTVTVMRTGDTSSSMTVQYATSAGTATADVDYTDTSGTLTFAPGDATKTFDVLILDDDLTEDAKTIMLALSNPTNDAGLATPSTAVLTITANDVPLLQFSASTYHAREAGANVTITVTRTGGFGTTVTVDYATSDGTATAGSDYVAVGGTLTFGPQEPSKTFVVHLLADTLAENDETIALTLSNPGGGARLGLSATAVLTIERAQLQFSVGAYRVAETAGSKTITVTRAGGLGSTVTVDYATSDGTATAGQDYTTTTGTLSFGPATTSLTFTVPILEDTLTEGDETITLTLSNPSVGAALGSPSTATLTILANDVPRVAFSAAAYSATEPSSRAITVTRGRGFGTSVTVDYTTSSGTATAGSDYTTTTGTLSFGPSDTSLTFTVPILDDVLTEGDETITLTLSNPGGGAVLGMPSTAVLTILANDPPVVAFSAATYTMNETGASKTITVRRTGGFGTALTVDYATSDGTATAGQDYTETLGTLSFGPSTVEQVFAVPILDEMVSEGPETIDLRLSNPSPGAVLGTPRTAVLTILANDVTRLSFNAPTYSRREGASATITVTRSGGFFTPVTVRYATSNGTATAGRDYTGVSGTLTFSANGSTTQTFVVPILEDTRTEGAETINLTLSNPTNGAVLVTSTAVLTILANDVPTLRFSTSAYTVSETAGSKTVTVLRGGGTGTVLTVHYATSDGTATAGVDYTTTSGTLTFGVNETSQTFSVPILTDTLTEGAETITLTLSNATNGAVLVSPSSAMLTISAN